MDENAEMAPSFIITSEDLIIGVDQTQNVVKGCSKISKSLLTDESVMQGRYWSYSMTSDK